LRINLATKITILKFTNSKEKLPKFHKKPKTVPKLIGHVRSKYEELKLYRPPTTDLSVLQEREKIDRVYAFLAALDPSYEAVRAQVLLSTEKLTFDAITTLIRQEATRRVAMGSSDSNPKSEA
jgi:hypothetical protein